MVMASFRTGGGRDGMTHRSIAWESTTMPIMAWTFDLGSRLRFVGKYPFQTFWCLEGMLDGTSGRLSTLFDIQALAVPFAMRSKCLCIIAAAMKCERADDNNCPPCCRTLTERLKEYDQQLYLTTGLAKARKDPPSSEGRAVGCSWPGSTFAMMSVLVEVQGMTREHVREGRAVRIGEQINSRNGRSTGILARCELACNVVFCAKHPVWRQARAVNNKCMVCRGRGCVCLQYQPPDRNEGRRRE